MVLNLPYTIILNQLKINMLFLLDTLCTLSNVHSPVWEAALIHVHRCVQKEHACVCSKYWDKHMTKPICLGQQLLFIAPSELSYKQTHLNMVNVNLFSIKHTVNFKLRAIKSDSRCTTQNLKQFTRFFYPTLYLFN